MAETKKFERFKEHLQIGDVEGMRENLELKFIEKIIHDTYELRPIHLACQEGYIETVKLLIEKKCNIESESKGGLKPIHYACWKGHTEIVKLLIENKCDIESEEIQGWRPIHYACWKGHIEIVELLIKKKCNIESKTKEEMRPIHYACWDGHIEIVKLLILHNCLVDVKDRVSKTPLVFAKLGGHWKIIQLISDLNAVTKKIYDSILKNDDKGFAKFYKSDLLTGRNWLEMVWDQKADKIIEYFLNTPIDVFEIRYMKTLKENDKNDSTNSNLWEEVLLYKCIRQHYEEGFQLMCRPAIINRPQKIIPYSFLEFVAENGNSVLVEEILRKSIFDSETWERAKDIALKKGDRRMRDSISNREYLLKCRQKINLSILHTAVSHSDPEMVKYILSQGLVDPNHNHEIFGTALSFAILLCHHECLVVLKHFKISCNTQNKYLQSPLHEVISNGIIEHCQYVIDHVKNIDQPGFMGQTALHCAVMRGCEDLCNQLMEKGADCVRYMKVKTINLSYRRD